MLQLILIRLVQAFFTLLVLSAVVFFGTSLTGDAALAMAPPDASQSEIAHIRKNMGLDKPILVRYGNYVKNAVRGDLGRSSTMRRPVAGLIWERLPNTMQLAGAGLFLAIVIGIPLGILAAVNRDSIFDQLARGFAILGMSAPQFWVAIMLIMLFGGQLEILPTYGKGGLDHFVLPAFAISLFVLAGFTRLTRSAMLEVLDSEYVRFARIKGLSERMVIFKHALKNALIPVLTFGGISFAGLLNGSIVVEVVYAWPGLGRMMLDSITQRDIFLIEATILTSGLLYILMATMVDILYAYVDPRIRPE